MKKKRVLVVDDEPGMLEVCEDTLQFLDDVFVVTESQSPAAAERLRREKFDLLITDLRMPGLNGVELLRVGRESDPELPVLMITAYPSVESAVEAMKLGAIDYITKPFIPNELLLNVQRLLDGRVLQEEHHRLEHELEQTHGFDDCLGESEAMKQVFSLVQKVAKSNVDVLILGETGTGKELVARAIHRLSPRKQHRFVPVDCGALPENLVESQLFGYERGAFTGAEARNIGLLEFANRGTCFFDEVAELSLTTQVKLLRTLQERKVRRVGGNEPVEVDLRVVAATCQELELAVERGEFREDLYFRINVVQILLPPLRERGDDILLLANHFLRKFSEGRKKEIQGFAPSAKEAFLRYSWPGNIRELQNIVRRAIALSSEGMITCKELPLHLLPTKTADVEEEEPCMPTFFEGKEEVISAFERNYLVRVLQKYKGDVALATQKAELPRGTFYRLMKKYNLSAKDYRVKKS